MLKDILSSKESLFADNVLTVLRGQENRNRRVILVNGNMTTNTRSETRGVNARVIKNGVQGFSSMAEYSDSAAEAVLKAATENALFLDSHAPRGLKAPKPMPGKLFLPHRDIVDFEQKRIIDACKEMDDYIVKTCYHITSRRVVYTEDSQDKIIYTSDCACGHVVSPRCYIYVFLTAETKDGTPVELFKAFGGPGSFEDNFSDLSKYYKDVDALYRRVMDKSEGVYAEAGLKTVILDGMMAGMLTHEAVGHTVEADLVTGGSVAGPMLNKPVASELVTMVDYAHTAFGKQVPLPVFLDDEGVTATDAVLIRDGILTGYMNDRASAEKYGMTPNGNARAWAFSDEPLIRMRNTAISPGIDKLDDMIASIDDGYYLIESGNGQADLTGEFMFGVTMGYEIKNGKLGKALLDTTVSGVAFDMLKTVDMVSDEVVWSSSGFCGKKQMIPVSMGGPALRCKIMIGGR
ncbi:MAG: TldD/PmbA family protein [Lachnospiraceae bacterium]|nr:TldD/PmbA family protein [Lachnospiraceae bacterium]MBR4993008.1 TldD/PmbA family protein [Lachnospiraceae bacterium]